MVKITCDSTADLDYLFNKRDISVIPLMVVLGNETYYDSVDITPDMIYAHVSKTKQLPKTAARSADDYYAFFKHYTDQDMDIVHFSISGKLSLSNESAVEASNRLEKGRVFVIDGQSLSTGTGLLAMYAKDLAEAGMSAQEIYQKCLERVPSVQASFVVDSMEYLYKGGRCSGLAAFAASMLKIKPTLLLKDGKITVGKKYLGRSIDKLIPDYVDNILNEYNKPDKTRIFITHTLCPNELVERVRTKLSEDYGFSEILETTAGSTVASHCGKGTLGILYINDGV